MRLRTRVRKVLFWGLLLLLCTLAGGLGFAYSYYTDSATLRALLKTELARYLPAAQVDVETVRVRVLWGEVKVTKVAVRQTLDGVRVETLHVPWLLVKHDGREVLKGRFEPREVIVVQPTLRLCQRRDGTWNLQGLLANPWPAPPVKESPPVVIQNGTIELVASAVPERDASVALLRDASIKVEPAGGRRLKFEGTAKGEVFDRLKLSGTIDLDTGVVSLAGDVTRLVPSEKLSRRLPSQVREKLKTLGMSAGEVDLELAHLTYDPGAAAPLSYAIAGRLGGGRWNCEKLPFPIDDVSARFSVRDGVLTIDRADGSSGSTTVRALGTVALQDMPEPALELHVEVGDLALDERLRRKLPPMFTGAWDEFQPRGRINLTVDMHRAAVGGRLTCRTHAECLDVGMLYRFFKYPLDHVRGQVDWVGNTVTLNLGTLIGGKELRAKGTIVNPGPRAVVKLDFQGQSLPIDKALLDAIPEDIRKVINDFQPSGSVRGAAHFERHPPGGPRDDPKGKITIDAALDLNERCAIRWVGLPYPIENLTGHLEVHPDHWTFRDMRGGNGQAVVTGHGDVRKVGEVAQGKDALRVELNLHAERLPFDQELQQSLPQAWQKAWPVLNPIGSSDVDAHVLVEPNKEPHYHIEIVPRPATSVWLKFERMRRSTVDPGGIVELRMEDVRGRFVFNDGDVDMKDVTFRFRESPVQFAKGTVQVKDDGSFRLAVADLVVREFRFDPGLREKMPPLMAQFARRLDEGTFVFSGNLGLDWSGRAEQPVRCIWSKVRVVLVDNSVQAGLPLTHIQGLLENVEGRSDGELLEVHGYLNLDSIYLMDQQVTRVEAPFHVEKGVARLKDIHGELLGGEIGGNVEITLDDTPRYAASLTLRDADLERYARTIPGRQRFRGLVSANIGFKGMGNDLHTLEGEGEAHVAHGDLGELPGFLPLMKFLTLSPVNKSAFDSADVFFKIRNGQTYLDPIKLTGNALSLHGRGTLDIQGALDLRLRVLYGRDRVHVALLGDALREVSGQFLVVRVQGTPAYPKFGLEPLPAAKALAERRAARLDAGEFQGERRLFNLPFRP